MSLCASEQPLSFGSTSSDGRVLPLFDLCMFWLPRSFDADALVADAMVFAHSLRYLHLISFQSLSDQGLMHVLRSCALLHTLDIRGCARLTPKSLGQIGACIPKLHSLNLSFIPAVSDHLMADILPLTPALHSLHLEQTNTSSDLLPLIAATVHLLCLNVRRNGNEWNQEALAEYKHSRDYAIQLQSEYEDSGEK